MTKTYLIMTFVGSGQVVRISDILKAVRNSYWVLKFLQFRLEVSIANFWTRIQVINRSIVIPIYGSFLFQNPRNINIHFDGVGSIWLLMKKQTRIDQVLKIEKVILPWQLERLILKIVSYPLYLIHVPEIYDLKGRISINFIWVLNLHKSLRIKITFLDFKIYEVFGFCPHYVSIRSIFRKSSKIFTYCGVMSMFSIYPPDFEVLFQLHMGNAWYVKLDTIFDLISANIIENYKLEDNKFYKSVHVYHLKLILTYITTYKILVEKYQKIYLFSQLPSHSHAIIYNGPGYLAQKNIVQSKSQPILINSFQIIVQFVTKYAEDMFRGNFLLTYNTLFGNFNNEVLSKTRMVISMSFTSKSMHTSSRSILLFRSPHQSSVNATFVRYNFQGIYDPSCPYGAVSFFEEINLKNITEIKSICSSSYEGHFQNVYSSTGRMFIVFYAYRKYSSLNVTVNVSYTRCQSVRIHACILFETCLRRYIMNLSPIRETCFEDHQYKLIAITDKRLRASDPQMHIFAPVPSGEDEDCAILQMTTDPQFSHPLHEHLYYNDRRSHGCSFYLNFKNSFVSASRWSFRIAGFFSHPSRFHIVREPQVVGLEKIYEIYKQEDRTKGVFDYDECSSNIGNIKPMPGKDIAIDLVHNENAPENLLYFVYFNMWTKDNVNPSWLDIFVTTETNTSALSKDFVILNKIPYEIKRVMLRSDQFLTLSFPKPRTNRSRLLLQAEADHYDTSFCDVRGDWEYMVFHWEKIYSINVKQRLIIVALPQAISNMTAQMLDDSSLTANFIWKKLPQMSVTTLRANFCRHISFKREENGCPGKTYIDDHMACHAFKMPLFYYVLEQKISPLPETLPSPYLWDESYKDLQRQRRHSILREKILYSWMNATETCEDKGMSLPEFLSRRDQEELLYLLKSTIEDTSIFPVKALFIGLYGSSSKVTRSFRKIHVTNFIGDK